MPTSDQAAIARAVPSVRRHFERHPEQALSVDSVALARLIDETPRWVAYHRPVRNLDGAAIEEALQDLPDWTPDGGALSRTLERRDWTDAIAFVNVVAAEAERRNHHPDVCISGYRSVTFRLTSHDSGGITKRDVDFARWIDKAATDGAAFRG